MSLIFFLLELELVFIGALMFIFLDLGYKGRRNIEVFRKIDQGNKRYLHQPLSFISKFVKLSNKPAVFKNICTEFEVHVINLQTTDKP